MGRLNLLMGAKAGIRRNIFFPCKPSFSSNPLLFYSLHFNQVMIVTHQIGHDNQTGL
jgi:hypothetical protein